MKPHLAALAAGLFAVLGLGVGLLFGGIAHWLVALVGGFAGLAGLAPWVRLAVVVVAPPVAAGLGYMFVAHGPEPAWTWGQAGVVVGALLGALVFQTEALAGAALVVLAPAVLGALAALAGAARGAGGAPEAAPAHKP